MKSCVLFITLLLITSVMSWAQLFEKTYQVPGLGLASSHGVFLSDGNLIQTGCLSPSPAQHAILLSKLQASDGDTIWSKIFHAPNMLMSGTQVVETDNHHLIVTANGVDSGNANNYHHVFLLDLDSNGNLLQSATYDNLGGYSGMYSTGMRFFPDHSLITMSVSYDSLGIVIQKHGPGGALLFSKSILPLGTAGLSGGAFFDVIRKGDAYYFVGD